MTYLACSCMDEGVSRTLNSLSFLASIDRVKSAMQVLTSQRYGCWNKANADQSEVKRFTICLDESVRVKYQEL